jgi:hypothetical protein
MRVVKNIINIKDSSHETKTVIYVGENAFGKNI